jgi:hypothetical protein
MKVIGWILMLRGLHDRRTAGGEGMTQREQLKAIVAIWLTNGNKPVDGCNDTREYLAGDYYNAMTVTRVLCLGGFLEAEMDEDYALDAVVPTAKGILEVLS